MKVYIAFSIHGSNRFIVATNEVLEHQFATMINVGEFSQVASRRQDHKTIDGFKLHWSKLLKKDGTPHTAPAWVLRRFNELEKMGWTIIGRKEFINHFYKGVSK